jgi:hypothetical protein
LHKTVDLLAYAVRGKTVQPSTYGIAGRAFLRLLGLVYLVAFASLWTQVEGLVGSQGILPAADYMDRVASQLEAEGRGCLAFPTLCWLSTDDGFLNLLCAGGGLLALVAVFFPFSALLWFLLWSAYLSLVLICQDFLGFQWDILLLETGFLAIFLAPMRLLPWGTQQRYRPSPVARWLCYWLLFRLLFASGLVKLTWDDPTWWNLSALQFHYETQCLPPWTAWYFHQLPAWFQQASVAGTYFIECVLGFFVFFPRRLRLLACQVQIAFQGAIIVSGNYCFFNYVTIALCLLVVDDTAWRTVGSWLKKKSALPPVEPVKAEEGSRKVLRTWPRWVVGPIAAGICAASIPVFVGGLHPRAPEWPAPARSVLRALSPFHLVNSYGLFRVMTAERPEIIIEGSNDGKEWQPYAFKYKPGDLSRRPGFVAPHQPRLDWQMWFAALGGNWRSNRWFAPLCIRLLEGSEPVLELLARNPFPGKPPQYVRALLYNYNFTTPEERKHSGNWWKRERRGVYLRAISLRDIRRR